MAKQISSFAELASTVQVGQVYRLCQRGQTTGGLLRVCSTRVETFSPAHTPSGVARGIAADCPKHDGVAMRSSILDVDFIDGDIWLLDASEYAGVQFSYSK